jgi:hypothetical protein
MLEFLADHLDLILVVVVGLSAQPIGSPLVR